MLQDGAHHNLLHLTQEYRMPYAPSDCHFQLPNIAYLIKKQHNRKFSDPNHTVTL